MARVVARVAEMAAAARAAVAMVVRAAVAMVEVLDWETAAVTAVGVVARVVEGTVVVRVAVAAGWGRRWW